MSWRKKVSEALISGMKYCFKPVEGGAFPELDEGEFYGSEEDNQPGFSHFVQSVVYDEVKRAFFDGYLKGAEDSTADANEYRPRVSEDLKVDPHLNKIGAYKRWDEREKKDAGDEYGRDGGHSDKCLPGDAETAGTPEAASGAFSPGEA